MDIKLLVGIFFLILATVFAVSSARGQKASDGPAPVGRVHRRVAVVFGLVGVALVLFHFLGR